MRPYRLALALAVPALLHAQSADRSSPALTLQDAIVMAQQQGPLAQIARSQRDAAQYHNDAFNARLLPQLVLSGQAANLNQGINPILQNDGTTAYLATSSNVSSLFAGFSQAVPLTGGTVSVGTGATRTDIYQTDNTTRSTAYQTTPVLLSLRQDLFKPRQIVWNERIQSLNASVAQRGYLEAREDVAASTADAFFNLFAQQMTLANAQANVSVNDTLYALNKGRFEVGKIGENELLKSELALLRARASGDDAKLARDRAEAALRRMISYPDSRPLRIVTPDSIPIVDADPEVAVKEALKNSSAIQQNDLDDTQTRLGIDQAKSNNHFNATVQASVGFNQTSNVFGQAYQSPVAAKTLSVGVNLPMLQWGAGKADVQEAMSNEQRVAANNRIRRDALIEDARFSALTLQQAKRNVAISAKADTVAAKQFEVAHNRYIIGKITNDALYLAQSEKDDAVISKVQALRNYWTAYYHLRRVTLYDFANKQELSEIP